MKLRTVLISVVVSAALIGGAGYGAYYAAQSRKAPVEVVPVANVNMGYYGMDQQETIYGSVTSQVAQTVRLDDEYAIDKIFVKLGDKVKEGTPLFSYDMTLQELELEMQQLELQTNELTMTRLEKELEKLKKTPATASLTRDWFTLTASAEEGTEAPDEILQEESETTGAADGAQASGETEGIAIDDVEQVKESEEDVPTTAEEGVLSFDRLVLEIEATFLACGDELRAADVGEAIEKAADYYRRNLAQEKRTEEAQEDGSVREVLAYEIRDEIREALDEEELESLRERVRSLEEYQIRYVEMLIEEAQKLEPAGLPDAVGKLQELCGTLTTEQLDQVENLEDLDELALLAEEVQKEQSESGTEPQEGETQPAQSESGTDAPAQGQPESGSDAQGGETSQNPGDAEGQTPESGQPSEESGQEVRQNTVTFDVAEGASAIVAGQDVTNSFALAENGRIVFSVKPETGYMISNVLVDGSIPARKNEESGDPDDYVVEGIQTNDTIVTVRTQMTQETGTPEESGDPSQTDIYTVTINPGNLVKNYKEGDLVPLNADLSDVTLAFIGWSVAPASGQADQTVALDDQIIDQGYASFKMPAFDVVATAMYQDAPDAINSYVDTFLANAGKLLDANAEQLCAQEGKDFLTELESAVVFYQQWLSRAEDEIQDENADAGQELEKFQLLGNVSSYLTNVGRGDQAAQLSDSYRELCLLYVKTMFTRLNSAAIDKELLEKASNTYRLLGAEWRKELEKRWKEEQANLAEQSGQPWRTNKKGKRVAPDGFLGIGDTLAAYSVMQMFQEYLSLPPETTEQERYSLIWNIWSQYLSLTEAQQALVSTVPLFIETLRQYGLWEETEPMTDFPDGGFGDGYDDFGDEPMYTASELQEMIEEKEQEIKSCELDIRQSELDVKQKQRIVDGKIVKSTMEGTIVSLGGEDGESDDGDYFLKVSNETGLYAKGTMSELALEKINVGDTITGTLGMSGASFTAVIKEVSEYPEANNDFYYYGQGNSNASYYPFYALIEDTEGLEEGDAEIYLSPTAPDMENGIYLENFYVRSETDGRTYVYKEAEDGTLTKQYVTTGKNLGYAMEITDGLTIADSIAFPYGKDVVEGAKTKEVDRLQDAYM